MIEIFEGRIGGGKSYLAVATILAMLQRGGVVYTNIELHLDNTRAYLASRGWELGHDQYRLFDAQDAMSMFAEGAKLIGPKMVVLDEAQLWLSARDWSENKKRHPDLLALLTQSRKLHMDIVFITQHASNIDGVVRRLAMFTWRCRDVAAWTSAIIGFGVPSFMRFYRARIDYDGKTVLNWQLVPFSLAVAKCYESVALLKPIALAGTEKRVALGAKRKVGLRDWLATH